MKFAILWYEIIEFRCILLLSPAHTLCAFHRHIFIHILKNSSVIYSEYFFSVHLMNVKALFLFYASKWILPFPIGLAWASTFSSPQSSLLPVVLFQRCVSNIRNNRDDLPSKSSAIFKTYSSCPSSCFLFNCSFTNIYDIGWFKHVVWEQNLIKPEPLWCKIRWHLLIWRAWTSDVVCCFIVLFMELIDDLDGLAPSRKMSSKQPLVNPLVSVFFKSLSRASLAVCPCFLLLC